MPLILRLATLAPFVAVALLLEALTRPDRRPINSVPLNLLATVIYFAVDVTATASLTAWAVVRLTALPGYGILRLPQATSAIGTLALCLVYVAFRDFFYYWLHRAQHRFRWLWAQHAVHHSDESVNATTAWRHHWTESLLESLCVTLPVVYLCAVPPLPALLLMVVLTSGGLFIHMHSRISFGAFDRVIASPRVHQVHHSVAPEHIDKNFAAFFPLWDVLFGTYVHPDPVHTPPTGLASRERITTLAAVLMWPFHKWWTHLGLRHNLSDRDA